jgi:hypothetical protein
MTGWGSESKAYEMETEYCDLGDSSDYEKKDKCFDKSYNKKRDEGWE